MLLHTYNDSAYHTLFSASTRHVESLISRLVSLGIDLNAVACNCNINVLPYCRCGPPLHSAIVHSNPPMVAALLRHGASIIVGCNGSGDNAVHLAIDRTKLHSGHYEIPREADLAILRMLLGGGRLNTMNTPTALDSDGRTWLNRAVLKCPRTSVTLVMPFLVRGLDVNLADNRLLTPLHMAVLGNRPDLARMLLQRGAKYRGMDSRGVTPFATACNRPNCELIDLLLNRDAGLIRTVVNDGGETAEVCLQRSIDRLMLTEDREDESFVREMRERTCMLLKLQKLASASRRAVGVRCVLQVYFFCL